MPPDPVVTDRTNEVLTVPPWPERLGGKHLASWPMFLRCAPVPIAGFTIAGLVRQPDATAIQALKWFGVVVASCAAVAMLMVVWRNTLLKDRFERPIAAPVSLACLGSGGTVLAVCFIGGSQVIGVAALPNPIVTVVVLTGLAAWWGMVMVLLLDSRERINLARNEVFEAAVRQEIAAVGQADLSRLLRDYLDTRIDGRFQDIRARLDVALASTESSARSGTWIDVSEDLRVTARSSVRDVSAELWNTAEAQYPRASMFSIVPAVIRTQQFQPAAVANLVVLLTVDGTISQFGTVSGVLVAVLGALGVFAMLSLGNSVINRHPTWTPAAYLAVFVTFSVGSLVSTVASGQKVSGLLVILTFLVTAVLVVATSSFAAVTSINVDILRQLSQRVSSASAAATGRQRQLAIVARQAAQILHGQVQTRLIACAATLDRAMTSGDLTAFTAALTRARETLESPLALPAAPESSAGLVEQLRSQWDGLVDVQAKKVDEISDGSVLQDLRIVLEEAITNAFHHGDADVVSIQILSSPQEVHVMVDDNGAGVSGDRHDGTGTALFTHVAGTRWSLGSSETLSGGRLQLSLVTSSATHTTDQSAWSHHVAVSDEVRGHSGVTNHYESVD